MKHQIDHARYINTINYLEIILYIVHLWIEIFISCQSRKYAMRSFTAVSVYSRGTLYYLKERKILKFFFSKLFRSRKLV